MSYYRTINGKKMDAAIIDKASLLTKYQGDGRISITDANLLMGLIQDGNRITPSEQSTIDYLFQNYKWTPSAKEWFYSELKAW